MKHGIFGIVFSICLIQSANATLIEFDGSFSHTGQVDLYEFSVDNLANIDIWSDSYDPGFDVIATLYNASGQRVTQNDDAVNFKQGQSIYDFRIKIDLVGDFTLAISKYNNFLPRDMNEITEVLGDPMIGQYYTGYHFNIEGDGVSLREPDSVSSVPEPGIMALLGFGLLGLTRMNKRN